MLSRGTGPSQGNARTAPVVAVVSFLGIFGLGLVAMRITGRPNLVLAGTLGAFAVSALLYYGLRAKAADGSSDSRMASLALSAYAPFLVELRKAGLEPVSPILAALLQRLCALRNVRTDYFLVADESFRFLLGGLARIGALRAGLGEDPSGLARAAKELESEVRARGVTLGDRDDPEVARLGERLAGVQAGLDAHEILAMAAIQLAQEARRLGRECDFLLAMPQSHTGDLLTARIEREKALGRTLERVFALLERN